jgi:N-methylhydantoinase B
VRPHRGSSHNDPATRPEQSAGSQTADRPDLRIAEIPDLEIDPITLDIIENALRHARFEMDAVLFRSAMSPVIREQHDEFPMITDPKGRMVVGQFGAYISEMMAAWDRGIFPGDVILTSDPYKCSASISHTNDWLVLVPIFFEDELVGWSSQFGHQMDAGGRLPGSLPTTATTIFDEALIIPPLKIVERGEVAEDVLRLILNNVRLPEMNRADLFAIIAGCRAGERRVVELCERFGQDVYLAALQALLDRTHAAMRTLIGLAIPEEPQTFEDFIDDDGLGHGPYRMKLTIWREGDHAWFDWSGTDPQALGPINFYLSEGMFKMFIGVYLIMVNDPQILFNDGFYPLLHVVMPEGSLLNPRFPAALGCRTHALTRLFDVLGGALTKQAPELNTAAGYGTSPYMLYSGWKADGEFFYAMEILYGGIPGRPIGDGMDGHSWWPLFENIPTEYLEAYYPLRIDGYTTVTDSGGPGLHRGGNGVEKRYVYLEPGQISIHDDRWLTRPWGVLGGLPGQRSTKLLRRADGTEEVLPSKCDEIEVQPGDMLIYRTAGGGGWKDRLERPADVVARDVRSGLVSRGFARDGYGVVLDDALGVDEEATAAERERQRAERGEAAAFDFGPSLEEAIAACRDETGLEPPTPARPLRWSALEDGEAARARVRAGWEAERAGGDGAAPEAAG